MRISETQGQILAGLQFSATKSIKELASSLKLKHSTVHYHIQRFREAELIRPAAFVDFFKLGLLQYSVFYSLTPENKKLRKELWSFLSNHSRVVWFAELGGQYQYATTLVVNSALNVFSFLQELEQIAGDVLLKRDVIENVHFTSFAKNYLTTKDSKSARKSLSMGLPVESVDLDETDYAILEALFDQSTSSHEQKAKSLRIPRSTFSFRLNRLTQKGIVRAEIYYINSQLLGRLSYLILLSERGSNTDFFKQLTGFCIATNEVVNLKRCLGSWDYELTVEVQNEQQVVEVCQSLCRKLSGHIADIVTLPVFRKSTSSRLFSNWELANGNGQA